jgi:carbamate kinase
MRVVIALGGNAIAGRGGATGPAIMKRRIGEAARAIADIARSCETVITHGNGPQVGSLSLQALAQLHSNGTEAPQPLDVIGAESEGMIGYLLEREIASIFPARDVATLLTQVEVDPKDPAFEQPEKPIGPRVSESEATELSERFGWTFRSESGGHRRVVPSPRPLKIRELRTIEILVDAGVLVVCAGGGGVPVIATPEGAIRGVEGVIDKDRTAALLGEALAADALLLLTDVSAVYTDWPEPAERALRTASPEIAKDLELDPGSMGPKLEAACDFASRTGAPAMIGSLDEARRVLQGLAGTRILPGEGEPTWWEETNGESTISSQPIIDQSIIEEHGQGASR